MSEKKRILFVDDDRNVLNGLRRMLHKMRGQWKMEFVDNAPDALVVMANTPYDIIVSDMRMPGMDGIQLLGQIKEKYPETIRFMMSGFIDKSIHGFAAMAAHQFVAKPCDADQLNNLINRAFALKDRLEVFNAKSVLASMTSLPVMPDIYNKIIETLNTPLVSANQIGRLIASDIGMSAKVLQIVNSSVCGPAAKIVDTVHAVVYLGLKTVEGLVLTHGVFSTLSEKQMNDFSVASLQAHCFRVGELTKAICRSAEMSESEQDLAAMAAILHDIGKMVLISKFPDEYKNIIYQSRQKSVSSDRIEQQMLGFTHAEFGGALLDLWAMPTGIVEAAAFHHEPWLCRSNDFSIVTAVYIADAIDHELCCGLSDGFTTEINIDYLEEIDAKEKWLKWRRKHLGLDVKELVHAG